MGYRNFGWLIGAPLVHTHHWLTRGTIQVITPLQRSMMSVE